MVCLSFLVLSFIILLYSDECLLAAERTTPSKVAIKPAIGLNQLTKEVIGSGGGVGVQQLQRGFHSDGLPDFAFDL